MLDRIFVATLASDRPENRTAISKPIDLLASSSLLINIFEKFLHDLVVVDRPRRLVPPSQQRMSTVWAVEALEVEKSTKNPEKVPTPLASRCIFDAVPSG